MHSARISQEGGRDAIEEEEEEEDNADEHEEEHEHEDESLISNPYHEAGDYSNRCFSILIEFFLHPDNLINLNLSIIHQSSFNGEFAFGMILIHLVNTTGLLNLLLNAKTALHAGNGTHI